MDEPENLDAAMALLRRQHYGEVADFIEAEVSPRYTFMCGRGCGYEKKSEDNRNRKLMTCGNCEDICVFFNHARA